MYSLTCTVSKIVDGLMNLPTVSWTDDEGQTVANGSDITVSTTIDDSASMSVLTFGPLRTSRGGYYGCGGSLESPALTMPVTSSVQEQLNVQSN